MGLFSFLSYGLSEDQFWCFKFSVMRMHSEGSGDFPPGLVWIVDVDCQEKVILGFGVSYMNHTLVYFWFG